MPTIRRLRIECTSTSRLYQRTDFENFDGCAWDPTTKTIYLTTESDIHSIMVLRYLGRHFGSDTNIEPPLLHTIDSKKWRYFFGVAKETYEGYYVSRYTLQFKTFQQYVEAHAYLKGLPYEEKYLQRYIGPHIEFVEASK